MELIVKDIKKQTRIYLIRRSKQAYLKIKNTEKVREKEKKLETVCRKKKHEYTHTQIYS